MLRVRVVGVVLLLGALRAGAQQAVTRADAERAAFAAGTRVALARADTAAALARLLSANTLPNPTLTASYSKSKRKGSVQVIATDPLETHAR